MATQKIDPSTERPRQRASSESASQEASDALLVVGIGASAGGLKALEAFFKHLPETRGMAFVVIVHLSPAHESQMAELLQQHTVMPVTQVSGSMQVETGHVYVIPPGKDLSMTEGHIHLADRPPRGHAPIDLFFRALAESHGHRAVAIVLSGTGSDGAVGLGRIKERGGLTMAQSPAEAEFDAMPRSAVETGHVDMILPVAELAKALQTFGRNVERFRLGDEPEVHSDEHGAILADILAHLRARTGHDFTLYKQPTVLRRLTRRLHLSGAKDLTTYLAYLREDDNEAHHLVKDLLLVVTSFFRDQKAFEALEKKVIAGLFEDRAADKAVRVWVCGCATGEEAYSVAMLLSEEAERRSTSPSFQVFASDVSESALKVAREGQYPEAIASDVSPERLKRYFDAVPGGYRIKNHVRERIVFAAHNLLHDPPFSRLDLVTCRNVFIYLDRSVHGRLFELFHYVLQPGGYLFLGTAESVGMPDLFRAVDAKHAIYERRAGPPIVRPSLSNAPGQLGRELATKPVTDGAGKVLDVDALHRTLITPYAPPSVIVSADHQVVHVLGGGEAFLKFTPGRPTQDVLKLVRHELRLELRTALYQAFRKAERTQSRAIPVRVEGTLRQVQLIVEPITAPGYANDHAHVLFRELEKPALPSTGNGSDGVEIAEGDPPHATAATGPSSLQEAEIVIRQLEDELDRTKEHLHTMTVEHEASAEEMTVSNEEVQAINEELRSTAEELETSKEELQSVNEELLALNEELKGKVVEINGINSDLRNLMNATEIGTIFLDRHLHVKRYTPRIEDFFEIGDTDLGTPLAELTHQLDTDALPDEAARVLKEHTMIEREVRDAQSGTWYLVRYRPYRTLDGAIEGVVITFVDVTEKKRYDEQLETLVQALEEMLSARAEQIKKLSSELVLTAQAERDRIALVLHDDLQQLLYAFQMRVDTISESLSGTQASRLSQANALISRALDVCRTLTVELSPPVLKGEDFLASIDWLALRMEDMHNLKVDVESSRPVYLPVDVRVLVYQLLRELLFNVVKHADVDHARVTIVQKADHLLLRVDDEGVGFDMAAERQPRPADQGGFGLPSVSQWLERFGGRLDVESAPGQGTRATIVVPLRGEHVDTGSTTHEDNDEPGRDE